MKLTIKHIRFIVVFFYLVGIAGFMIPYLKTIFISLTPLVLLFNFLLLVIYHNDKKNIKNLSIFVFIFISSILVEMAGVHTGKIFGIYHYGDGLGLKIHGTPLLIGLNWLFLSYTSSSLFTRFKINKLFQIVLASLVMVIYDLVLEQVAPHLDMWHWENNLIPLQNYIAWFVLALIFNSLITYFKINTSNKIAATVLFTQFFFFVVLAINYQF